MSQSFYTPTPPSPEPPPPGISPRWGSNIKLIIGLSFVALVATLVIYFRNIIGPLLLAFVLIYLLHPIVAYLTRRANLSWRASVNIIFLILIILLVGSSTLTGLAVFQQIQNLIDVVTGFVTNLDTIVADLSSKVYSFGPFQIDLRQFDLATISQQLVSYVQPLLSNVTSLVSTFAASAASILGWLLFILLISYFVLADASQVPGDLLHIAVPGYDYDIRRLGHELKRIWNAFLRGQLIIFTLVVISYTILMTILGVRYSIGIALMAGLARFVPYVGPFTTWTVTALVTLFMGSNYFGLPPWQYTLMVLLSAVVLDQIFDNIISPRLMGQSLGVHPAAVLVAALVAANLMGIIGLVLAAPTLATLQLLGRYTSRKMFDLDPWPITEDTRRDRSAQPRPWRRMLAWYRMRFQKKA